MKALVAALKDSPERTRLLLLGLSGATAAVVGFRLVPVATAKNLIQYGGYYYILAAFLGACFYGIRIASERRDSWLPSLRRPGIAGAAIVLATLFLFWSDTFKHKILFDEYVLQGTAYHMHATKEIGAVVRAYDINGSWLVIDTFLDKRPYFFAFLVSLLHDLTGYRVANIFVVNALLTPIFLGLVYWLARELTGLKPALYSLALLATLPLLGQNVSCAGMELHNLTMIAAVMVFAVLYLRAPSPDRLSLLVLSTVLLSQSRYESVIFVGPTALVILLGWRNAGRVIMSWPAVIAPLLLIPYAWHNRILSESPVLWQLNAGQTSRFSTSYLANNLEGAWVFFFNHSPAIANSFLLSLLGVIGLGAAVWRGWVWYRSPGRRELPAVVTVSFLFGLGIAGNLGILMFYYWSRLDDVIASRFALPMCLMLALGGGFLLKVLEPRPIRAMQTAVVLMLVWFFGWDLEAYSEKQYTNKNLVMQEIDWEHDFLKTRRGPVLFISNMSTIPFLLWQIPCILSQQAPTRVEQLRYHLNQHTFSEILIAQSLRPSDAQGDLGVDPAEVLPDSFKLKTLRIERFGSRCTRISQIDSIDLPPASKLAPKPKGLAISP